MADVAYNLDAVAGFAYEETFAIQNLPVAQGVKFGKSLAEFKLVSVNTDCPESSLISLDCIIGKTVWIDAQEIAYARFLKFQISGNTVKAHQMNDISPHRTEYPLQHIVKMYTDIGSDASTFADITFP